MHCGGTGREHILQRSVNAARLWSERGSAPVSSSEVAGRFLLFPVLRIMKDALEATYATVEIIGIRNYTTSGYLIIWIWRTFEVNPQQRD